FAIELQQQRKKVLLIDLDIGMGNIDVLLGISSEKTIADLFEKGVPVSEVTNTSPKGVDFISGGSGLKTIFNLDKQKRETFFMQYNKLVGEYDYIIFDIGAGVTEDSMHFILDADECIVVIAPAHQLVTVWSGAVSLV